RSAPRRSPSRSTRPWTRTACGGRCALSGPGLPSPEAARVARLATVGRDGRPHVVPICFALDGDVLYSAVDEKPKSTRRLRRLANIEAHPEVEVVVDAWDEDWSRLWWVRLAGQARIVEH